MGSGKPIREWLHVDDGAQAMFRSLSVERSIDPINIGTGKGVSILSVAELIKNIIGYDGEIKLDLTKIDGAKARLLMVQKVYCILDGSQKKNLKLAFEKQSTGT